MTINAQQRKQRIREAMITAAYQLICERGYDAVTVTDIADYADYGRSTFYLHFENKEALLWAILQDNMQAMDVMIINSVTELTSPARELQAWQHIFTEVEQHRLFFSQLYGELSRRLRSQQRTYLIDVFEQQLASGQYSLLIDVPVAVGARFIVGSLLEVLEYWLSHPEMGDAQTMAAQFFRLVYRQEPPQMPG